jgi:hypothetical protein
VGRPLIHKIVKPIKVARSCFADEIRIDELLVVEAKSQTAAAPATVLGEANATVRHKLTRFDLANRCFNEATKILNSGGQLNGYLRVKNRCPARYASSSSPTNS